PSDELLNHGGPRLVYGVELATNAGDYLLGLARRPAYVLPTKQPGAITQQIIHWWACRWFLGRLAREETCDRVARHTLVYPIRHGARVRLPTPDPEQGELFGDSDRV
ncbi:MAG TPA: hypothetical protein VFW33_06340, partial [Gemmataceae bacterium]|nr:hypothetical protein [Gemmataceae bacterium]